MEKVAVVTGTSRGIGFETALALAREGYYTYPTMRDTTKSDKIKELGQKQNLNIDVLELDVDDENSVKTAIQKILDQKQRIDVLVNNAGFVIYGKVNELSTEEIIAQMETNYFGMIHCTKAFLPQMLEQHSGHFVNIASVGASFGVPGIASYCATKYAMLGFSEGLRHELEGTGIGLTVVSPIMVRTPLFDHPSFENFSKFSTGISLSSETVAKAIIKAANSSRFEIVVPSVARAGIWFKQTFPYFINPIIGNAFRKQLRKRNS